MKFVRAWHAFIGADGALVPHGGRRLTIGRAADGAVYLTGEALEGATVRMTRETAARAAEQLAAIADDGADDAPAENCPACWHLWTLHESGVCCGKVYPAHSLTGEPCPCERERRAGGEVQ